MIPPVVHTVEVEIEISGDMIRLGQLLKFADLVTDGGQAKALMLFAGPLLDGVDREAPLATWLGGAYPDD